MMKVWTTSCVFQLCILYIGSILRLFCAFLASTSTIVYLFLSSHCFYLSAGFDSKRNGRTSGGHKNAS